MLSLDFRNCDSQKLCFTNCKHTKCICIYYIAFDAAAAYHPLHMRNHINSWLSVLVERTANTFKDNNAESMVILHKCKIGYTVTLTTPAPHSNLFEVKRIFHFKFDSVKCIQIHVGVLYVCMYVACRWSEATEIVTLLFLRLEILPDIHCKQFKLLKAHDTHAYAKCIPNKFISILADRMH